MLRIVLPYVALLYELYVFHIINGMVFSENIFKIKMCVLSAISYVIFLVLTRIEKDVINSRTPSAKYLLFLSEFNET
jgi:hypothetical protein